MDVCFGCGEFQCRGLLSCSTAAGPFATEGATTRRVRGASLTEAQRDSLTPDQVVKAFLDGNARFVSGTQRDRDFLGEMKSSAEGQYPALIVLSCIDSRTPVEVISDLGIGDTFNAKVAGNAVNDDILGSMEYACAVAGAKAVLVMGHTSCGAIKGAIDNVVLGNLTLLLARFKTAIDETVYEGSQNLEERRLRRRGRTNAGPEVGSTGARAQRGTGQPRGRGEDQDRRFDVRHRLGDGDPDLTRRSAGAVRRRVPDRASGRDRDRLQARNTSRPRTNHRRPTSTFPDTF